MAEENSLVAKMEHGPRFTDSILPKRSTLVVYIDDYVCAARLQFRECDSSARDADECKPDGAEGTSAEVKTDVRKAGEHEPSEGIRVGGASSCNNSGSDQPRPIHVFSSQILHSKEFDTAVVYPLGEDSDDSAEVKSRFGELSRLGLRDALDSKPSNALSVYLGALVKASLDLANRGRFIDDLVVAIPIPQESYVRDLEEAVQRIAAILKFKIGQLVQAHDAAQSPNAGYSLASFILWRKGFSFKLWTKANDGQLVDDKRESFCLGEPQHGYFSIVHGLLNEKETGVVGASAAAKDNRSDFTFSIAGWTDMQIDGPHLIKGTGRWRSLHERPISVSSPAGEPRSRPEEPASAKVTNHLGINVVNYTVLGSLVCAEDIDQQVRGYFDTLLKTTPQHSPTRLPTDDSGHRGNDGLSLIFKWLESMEIGPSADKEKHATAAFRLCDGSKWESLRHAKELESTAERDAKELRFELKKSEDDKSEDDRLTIELPLDPFDNDKRYLLEPRQDPSGRFTLALRAGMRPVPLTSTGNIELLPKSDRVYEIRFKSDQDVQLWESLSTLINHGVICAWSVSSDARRA